MAVFFAWDSGRTSQNKTPFFWESPKLELILAGKAKDEQSIVEGKYHLADGLINGYPHWINEDETLAIWFDKEFSSWSVGDKNRLGEDYGLIAGPYGTDSYPNEIKHGWEYKDNLLAKTDTESNGWKKASPNDVVFKVI